jgi:hypothetical protein
MLINCKLCMTVLNIFKTRQDGGLENNVLQHIFAQSIQDGVFRQRY